MAPEEAPTVAPKGVWGDALMVLRTALEVALEQRALNAPELHLNGSA